MFHIPYALPSHYTQNDKCWISTNYCFCVRFREREIEGLIRLTDSFTWEELPTTYSDTGYLTKAAYIPIIQRITKYLTAFNFGFHGIHSAVRMVMYHDMIYAKWYPFDASASPAYEITNLSQVRL
jgi:hypothetical protein